MVDHINKIIQQLGDDAPINGILLQTQIVAYKINNEAFKKWIYNEQHGYNNSIDLPEYRILDAVLMADISQSYGRFISNYTIPSGLFCDKKTRDYMNKIRITHSLSELETISNENKNSMIHFSLPIYAYQEANKLIDGNILKLWQEVSAPTVKHIIDVFKSKLLYFFLDLDRELKAGIDFSNIKGQKIVSQIMNTYNINAAVANLGDGNVIAGDIKNNDINQFLSDQPKQEEFKNIIAKLEKATESLNNKHINDALEVIKEECKKPNWMKKTMRVALNAISGVATGIAANQLTPIVQEALNLL